MSSARLVRPLHAEGGDQQIGRAGTVTEAPNERRGSRTMNLESDKRLNIQLRLDFSSAPTVKPGRRCGKTSNVSVVYEPERPANTSRYHGGVWSEQT